MNYCDGDLLIKIQNTLTRYVSFTSDLSWLARSSKQCKKEWNYLLGSTISFIYNEGYELTGSNERICQVTGAWSGDTLSGTLRTGLVPLQCYKLSLKNHYHKQGSLGI